MRVKCKLCKFEEKGTCSKKKSVVRVNKPRRCGMYSEDALKVLEQYRKSEAHKSELKRQEMRRAQFKQIIEDVESGKFKPEKEV